MNSTLIIFLKGWVFTNKIDEKCKYFGQQIREQLSNKKGIYVDLSTNEHYFAFENEVYIAFQGVPNQVQKSVKAAMEGGVGRN